MDGVEQSGVAQPEPEPQGDGLARRLRARLRAPVLRELSPWDHIKHPKKRAYLAAFARTSSVAEATKAAKVTKATVYMWRRDDPDFVQALEIARELAIDVLESEAVRRAEQGWLEPVWHQGVQVGTQRKYSDRLLEFLLKGANPEKYRDRVSAELGGPGGGPIPIAALDLTQLTEQELDILNAIATRITRPASDRGGETTAPEDEDRALLPGDGAVEAELIPEAP